MLRRKSFLSVVAAIGAVAAVWLGAASRTVAEGPMPIASPGLAVATFAGGCFWCVEAGFDKVPGVVKTISGYAGGRKVKPTYEEVSSGSTGHLESVEVHYDPTKITYEGLLTAFWRMIDPTDAGGSFVDRGEQYTSAIFYHDEAQRAAAEKSRDVMAAMERFQGRPIVTAIRPAATFYPAEDYHQDFHTKSTLKYTFYRHRSGRDQYLEKTWGKELPVDYSQYVPKQTAAFVKPSDADLRKQLTPMQYKVTQHEGTEPPFENEFWNEKRDGLYVDVVSGEVLFTSRDKFDSGTGWPSFTKPVDKASIVERKDTKFFITRTEVRSRLGDSHLGHVFTDGPAPTGLRYCINSASLRFVPVEELAKQGYAEYAALFGK